MTMAEDPETNAGAVPAQTPVGTGWRAPVEIRAAWIGGGAVLVAALIALLPGWFDDDQPTSPTAALSISRDLSPFTAYQLKKAPPGFQRHLKGPIRAFHLNPDADIAELLQIITLGQEIGPDIYPRKTEIVPDADKDPTRSAHLDRLWRVIEAAGAVYRRSGETAPRALSEMDRDNAVAGLAVLRRIYSEDSSAAERQSWGVFADAAFDTAPAATSGEDRKIWDAARAISKRRLFPVFDLTLTNPKDEAVLVTDVAITVKETVLAASGLKTGLISASDRLVFDLTPNITTLRTPLRAPMRVAPGDVGRVIVELKSEGMFAYLVQLEWLAGGERIAATDWAIVDFGFQPTHSFVD